MKHMTKLNGAAWLFMLALATASATAQSPAEFTWEANATGVMVTGRAGAGETLVIPPQIQGRPVTAIGTAAFLQSRLSVVVLPASVTSIGAMAFASNQLTVITIPAGVTSIGSMAFASSRLTSVAIPPGVASIGYRAFHGNQLSVVIVPDGIASIGDEAFGGATLLRPDGTPVLLAELQELAVASATAPTPIGAPAPFARRVSWTSLELTGLGLRQEWDVHPMFAVGGNIFANYLDDTLTFGALVTARYFPGGGLFYLELGVGWGLMEDFSLEHGVGWALMEDFGNGGSRASGFMIAPAMGLRLANRPAAFFPFNPFISVPFLPFAGGSEIPFAFRFGFGGEGDEVTGLAPLRANWLSVEITMLGGGLRKEWNMHDMLAIGVNAFLNTLDFNYDSFGVLATARYFPLRDSRFYLELGAGWGSL